MRLLKPPNSMTNLIFMINFSKKINIIPRWIIASLDGVILFQCVLFAFWLRANFDLSNMERFDVLRELWFIPW